jgi:cytochrome c-type biogenesis protein CcmH/NrfG
MSQSLTVISSHQAKGRVILAAAFIAAIAVAWFGVRWQLGSMLAELTVPSDPTAKYVAPAAGDLAPRDPTTAWLVARTEKEVSSPESVGSSVGMFENVVRLAPDDYRWWIELGRTNEQADRSEQAEMAFRRATDLAPAYAYPRWQFGNFLLRAGRSDEAFAEFRKTTANDSAYREQVFSLAWDYFQHDPAKVEDVAVDTPAVRASLAFFYAAHGQAADALRVWNKLTDEQKADNKPIARIIAQALTEKKLYRQGLEFSRQVGIDPDAQFETITNGGFEKPTGDPKDNYYGWNVERGDGKLDLSGDSSVHHSGNRSLRLTFRTFIKPELSDPWQVVAVQPGTSYTLHFWVRTENLRSAGMPTVEVVDPSDNRLIAASPAVATGTNDWQEVALDIKAPDTSDGIVVRVARSYCGEACPIVGIMWIDDFSLTKR